MVRDPIRSCLESLKQDGLPAPDDIRLSADPVKEELAVGLGQATSNQRQQPAVGERCQTPR
jgi:hypothetical protein